MVPVTLDDIRRAVTPAAFLAGQAYQSRRRVEEARLDPDGVKAQGRVLGSGGARYRQTIHILTDRTGRQAISGECTCPVGYNCKHVGAVMIQLHTQQRQELDRSLPARGPREEPLSPEVDAWLRGLGAAGHEDAEDYPPTVHKRLLYVLGADPAAGVTLGLMSVELRRDGTPAGAAKPQDPHQLIRYGQPPKYLRPSDRAIVRRMAAFGLHAEEFADTLHRIVATGRGRWGSWDGPVLREGPPVGATVSWTVAPDGRQRPGLRLPAPLIGLGLPTPWYADPATGAVGPADTGLPPRLAGSLLAAPPLPPAVARRVLKELNGTHIPGPAALPTPQTLHEALRPHLTLLAGDLPFDPAHISVPVRYGQVPDPALHRVPLARLSWDYGPVRLPQEGHWQTDPTIYQDGVLFHVIRDRRAEEAAAERLRSLGLTRVSRVGFLPDTHPHARDRLLADPDEAAWIEFVLDDVPRLRTEGWTVEVADDFPLRLVEPSGGLTFEIGETSGIDWFDFHLGVELDGERISLVPAVLELIANAGAALASGMADDALPLLLPLPDGRVLAVPMRHLQPMLGPLIELFTGAEFDAGAGALRLPRRAAGDLALLEGASAGAVWQGGEAVRALGRQLREHGRIPPVAVPDSFRATLRAYQEHGLAWLQFLRGAGLGGILADDMGLGKTVQALAHLLVEQEAGRLDRPALVVCPTSLVPNWAAEAARFAPGLRTLVLHGPHRAGRFGAIAQHDLVITTYPLLTRDHAVLAAQDWHVVVLDEAQTIKNPLAATSKLARTLRAEQRLCLSGTPLENHLGELWSLFDFLQPGFLGDRKQFGLRYRAPIEKAGNTERQALLAQRIAPFLLRRTKEQVAADLPPKTEIAEVVEFGSGQRAVYEGIRLAMHARVQDAIRKRGLAGSGIIILDALLKLRQACCDPRLVKLASARKAKAGSAKLERLLELLPQMLEEGRRVLLFSQFTSMLALIEAELGKLGLPYLLLTGDTRDRTGPVRRFQSGEVPLFLVSLKAGGVGLNLTAADTVIHYDPWWNPAVEDQATDRAHRIGQDKPVFVHKLVAAGTIEEKMQTLKERKKALAAGVLGAGGAAALSLTEADLEVLFSA